MTTDNLPPLPRPAHIKVHTDSEGFQYWDEPFYSHSQVEEIRLAAILAERERCAKVCAALEADAWATYEKIRSAYTEGRADGMAECAAAIRERGRD